MERVERLSQAYYQAPWRRQLQYLGLFMLGVVFIALVASIYLTVTARAGQVGREVQLRQSEMRVFEQQIADLRGRMGEIQSSAKMEQKARALGFEKADPDQIIYIVVPGYSERQPANIAPSSTAQVVGAPELPAIYTESLFTWLQKQFNRSIFPLFKEQP